jgi:hypothetical protein
MTKTLTIAAVLSIGVAGSAFAQATVTGAPAGTAPETAEPMVRHHHYYRHHHYHHHHMMAPAQDQQPAAPAAPAAPQ